MAVSSQRQSVRSKVLSVIDYCGDIARNGEREGTSYSLGYSPNNIRCLVISPNGVLVRYHLSNSATRGTTSRFVEYKPMDLFTEEESPNYKPILRMLATPLVHASIEEIVILTRTMGCETHQNYLSEFKPDVMVETFKGAGADTRERIANRFGRLRYFTTLNITLDDFRGYIRQLSQKGVRLEFYSEIPAFKPYANVTEFAGKDYWKFNGATKNHYPFDGALIQHFSSIADAKIAKERNDAIANKRNERLGSKIQQANIAIEDYARYSKIWARFYQVVQQSGSNGVLGDLNFVKKPEIFKIAKFDGMTKSAPAQFVEDQKQGDEQAIEANIKQLSNYRLRCARELATELITALCMLIDSGEPELVSMMMHDCETTVCVPSELASMEAKLATCSQKKFDGRDIDASIINCCWQFILFFVQYEDNRAIERKYWREQLSARR